MDTSTLPESGSNSKSRRAAAGPMGAPPSLRGITNEEIVLYVEGLTTPSQTRRILSGALVDENIAARLRVLKAALSAADEEDATATGTQFAQRADALRREMFRIVREEAAMPTETANVPASVTETSILLPGKLELFPNALRQSGGALWRATGERMARLDDWLNQQTTRALEFAREAMTLPALAPATASALPGLNLRRQTVVTSEGVRVEFQQLPGPTSRLRLLVDASDMAPLTLAAPSPNYKTAFVTLEERVSEGQHDRHILIVLLSDDGKGFTDFSLGASGRGGSRIGNNTAIAASQSLPPVRGGCHLVGIRLSQQPSGIWEGGV